MADSLLSLDAVNVAYDRTPIIHDLSLEVGEGEVVALIGRNGVGKTTLVKTIIGLLTPTSGTITYQDEDVTALGADERARRGIGYVPQGRDVFPRMTVHENLKMGENINEHKDRALFEEVYEFFPRLDERRNQRAGTMSGGEQQMLAIGRALIGDPVLLLLDETSEGIQPNIVMDIGETLRGINDTLGTTIFFVEQNLEFTIRTSDHCYVMEKGTVVDNLAPDQLEDAEIIQKYIAI